MALPSSIRTWTTWGAGISGLVFDPPILYPGPTSYGSVSANFVQGLSFVHRPLSGGDNVLTLESEVIAFVPDYYGPGVDLDIGVKYVNSWTIHISK